MNRSIRMIPRLCFTLVTTLSMVAQADAPSPSKGKSTPKVTLTRLDCGDFLVKDLNVFSDTFAYVGQSARLTNSCYLIRHGDQWMLWDTGLPVALLNAPLDETAATSATLSVSLEQQLAEVGVQPEDIDFVGISHYHFDHTGQAKVFDKATLLIGQGDWDGLLAETPPDNASTEGLLPWINGERPVQPAVGDVDVFGDGSVLMLATTGHTPGHHALLVQLEHRGPVILSGDAVHIRENLDGESVPSFNVDRADSIASLSRLRSIAENLGATLIIQHDHRDIDKLPPYPQAAR